MYADDAFTTSMLFFDNLARCTHTYDAARTRVLYRTGNRKRTHPVGVNHTRARRPDLTVATPCRMRRNENFKRPRGRPMARARGCILRFLKSLVRSIHTENKWTKNAGNRKNSQRTHAHTHTPCTDNSIFCPRPGSVNAYVCRTC